MIPLVVVRPQRQMLISPTVVLRVSTAIDQQTVDTLMNRRKVMLPHLAILQVKKIILKEKAAVKVMRRLAMGAQKVLFG